MVPGYSVAALCVEKVMYRTDCGVSRTLEESTSLTMVSLSCVLFSVI